MRLTRLHTALALALVVAAAPVFAADQATDRRATEIVELRNRTPEQAKAIVAKLTDADKEKLIREQANIDRLLATTSDPEAMTPDDRQTLWNSTKVIDSVIEGDRRTADEQLICKRERKVGTNFATRVCRTREQMEAERERGREEVDRAQVQTRR